MQCRANAVHGLERLNTSAEVGTVKYSSMALLKIKKRAEALTHLFKAEQFICDLMLECVQLKRRGCM